MPYIGTQVAAGNYRKLVDISTGFNGSTTSFTLAVPPGGAAEYYVTPASVNQLLISVGGVIQQPDVDFTVSTYTITFTTAPRSGLSFFGVLMGDALSMGAPGDGTVTQNKIALSAFTNSISSTSTTTIATPNSVKTAYDLANAALPLTGGTMTGVITYAAAQPRLVLATVNAGGTTPFPATGGPTSIDFTGIPSWVKRVTVMFNGVSTSGTSLPQVQIGAGSVDTTGYSSGGTVTGASSASSTATTGVVIYDNGPVATTALTGNLVINLVSSNTWVASYVIFDSSRVTTKFGGGSKTLSGTLDRVRITTTSTDTFDAGSINIFYEG
jgi:hypothetical protein